MGQWSTIPRAYFQKEFWTIPTKANRTILAANRMKPYSKTSQISSIKQIKYPNSDFPSCLMSIIHWSSYRSMDTMIIWSSCSPQ
eukprot:scaffold185897_cov22-Tisochrysis_lutea.AAC.3